MKNLDWSRLPLLVAMVLLMLAGAREYVLDDQDGAATALVAAGMVVLGAWVAVEVIAIHHRMHKDDKEDDHDAG